MLFCIIRARKKETKRNPEKAGRGRKVQDDMGREAIRRKSSQYDFPGQVIGNQKGIDSWLPMPVTSELLYNYARETEFPRFHKDLF